MVHSDAIDAKVSMESIGLNATADITPYNTKDGRTEYLVSIDIGQHQGIVFRNWGRWYNWYKKHCRNGWSFYASQS